MYGTKTDQACLLQCGWYDFISSANLTPITYGFATDQNGFTPCTDQGQIDAYINMIVPLFEADSRIHAYHYSDGEGLGNVWPSTKNGKLRYVY